MVTWGYCQDERNIITDGAGKHDESLPIKVVFHNHIQIISMFTDFIIIKLFIPAAGHICPFPFLFNGAYYDQCTRLDTDGSLNLPEDDYWCPSPFNITYASADYFGVAVFSNGGEVGLCPDFAKPPGIFSHNVMQHL